MKTFLRARGPPGVSRAPRSLSILRIGRIGSLYSTSGGCHVACKGDLNKLCLHQSMNLKCAFVDLRLFISGKKHHTSHKMINYHAACCTYGKHGKV